MCYDMLQLSEAVSLRSGRKAVPATPIRRVPISLVLGQMIREHFKEFGTALGSRLSRTRVAGSTWPPCCGRCSRKHDLRPSPKRRPRSCWPQALQLLPGCRLNAGTLHRSSPSGAGHAVEVLYRIYAHCLDGDDERWFTRMEQALG